MLGLDINKVVSSLDDELVAKIGAPLGLNAEQAKGIALSLAEHFHLGGEEAIKKVAEAHGHGEDLVTGVLHKLMDAGKDMLADTATEKVEEMKTEAMQAAKNAAGGLFGKLFGR